MQAEGEGQEPWLGTITWKVPGTDEQRSGTGVLIGPDIVCTTAELLYHSGDTIVTGTFDLGRARGQNAPREVDIIDCYLPPWYIHYENARSTLSRYHNFAFVKLARKIPGAPGLAMSDALPGLAADGGTELIALGLELSVPEEPNRFIRWPGHPTGYQPEYLWHLLRAIRPRLCLEYGIAVPALLD